LNETSLQHDEYAPKKEDGMTAKMIGEGSQEGKPT